MIATKSRVLGAINTVMPLESYEGSEPIFSRKYGISPLNMVYITKKLAEDFRFEYNNKFVDEMELCTFSQLEVLLEKYEGSIG